MDNPLLGARGAAAIYGPQKGLPRQDIARFDAEAARLAALVCERLGVEPADGWVNSVSGACSLIADGSTIVMTSDRTRSVYSFARRCWSPMGESPGPWWSEASGAPSPQYVTATGFSGAIEQFPWTAPRPSSAPMHRANTSTNAAAIRKGWQLVAENASTYCSWITSTAAGCALLEPSGRGPQSASSSDHPGLLATEPPQCATFCAEMLVHECSHQHLLAYASLAPLVDMGSPETAYSPIKGSRRPLLNSLFGGHAVGNILLYYLALRRTMTLDEQSNERFKAHRSWFAEGYLLLTTI